MVRVVTSPARMLPCPLLYRCIAAMVLLLPLICVAQVNNVTNDQSTPAPGRGHDYIEGLDETVNPANGSLSLRIPLPAPRGGRGVSLPLQFTYDSNGIITLYPYVVSGTISGSPFINGAIEVSPINYPGASNALTSGGWGYGLPNISVENIQVPWNVDCPPNLDNCPAPSPPCQIWTGYVFQDPVGSRHALQLADTDYGSCNPNPPSGYMFFPVSNSTYDSDGSYSAWWSQYDGTSVSGPLLISDNDATTYSFGGSYGEFSQSSQCNYSGCSSSSLPNYIEDRNGNRINFTVGQNPVINVTDTAGRDLVSISSLQSAAGDRISISGVSNPYIVHWKTTPLSFFIPITNVPGQPWYCGPFVNTNTSSTLLVVSSIELPNGESYQFDYDPTYGLLSKIIYPTGAYVQYTWGPSTQLSDAVNALLFTFTSPGNSLPPGVFDACSALYAAPSILHRYVSYDGVTVAQQQDFNYSTAFTGGAWTSKNTFVTTTDKIRNRALTTSYTYSPATVPNPPDIYSAAANQVPLENTVTHFDSNGLVLRTETKTWSGTGSNPFLKEEDVTLPNGQTSKTVYKPDANLPQEIDEYDFGNSAPVRITTIQYQQFPSLNYGNLGNNPPQVSPTTPPPILDRPCQKKVYLGSSDTLMAETDTWYDGGTSCAAPGSAPVAAVANLPPGTHDETTYGASSSTSRGNATTITEHCFIGAAPCSNSVTGFTYDETGQALTKTDGNGNVTNYTYTDNPPSSGSANTNTNAYLTKITYPTVNGIAATHLYSYDYASGLLASSTDENNQVTSYTYADPFNRLTEIVGPSTGGASPTTTYGFNDSSALSPPYNPTVTTTELLNVNGASEVSTLTMDPMGHPIETQMTSDPDGTDTVLTSYDGMGLIYTKTNPYRSTLDPTYGVTTNYYDGIGRPIKVQESDGSFLQMCYNGMASVPVVSNCSSLLSSSTVAGSVTGSWVDSTDENGNHWQRASDAFGRLTQVMEPSGSSQVPTMKTVYNYDVLNNLLSVTQNGVGGQDTPRTRVFTYDSLSRLIQSYNPETGWICYGQWSGGNCVNGYDPNGNLLFKTDARGVTTNYTYDNLNRLVAKTYSPNAPAGSLSSCYAFDTATNGIGRLAAEWTKAGSCTTTSGYQTMRQYLAYDSMGRLWNEQQCVLGHCTSGPTPPCAASGNIAPYYQTYCYDLAGNMTWNVNGVSNVPNVPGANTIGFSYTYDAAGRLSTLGSTWSDGLHPSPLFTADPTSGYTAAGALQNLTLGNSISVIKTYDNRLRATGETAKQQ